MLWIKSKKQKAEEEAKAEEEEEAREAKAAKKRRQGARDLRREDASRPLEATSKLGVSEGMLPTLRAIYAEQVDQGDMIEESDEHLEELIDIQEGSASEQRKEKIKGSDTDTKEKGILGKFASGIKGAFGKAGEGYDKVKKALSGKFGLVLLGTGLWLMNKFSDELFGPKGALPKLLK